MGELVKGVATAIGTAVGGPVGGTIGNAVGGMFGQSQAAGQQRAGIQEGTAGANRELDNLKAELSGLRKEQTTLLQPFQQAGTPGLEYLKNQLATSYEDSPVFKYAQKQSERALSAKLAKAGLFNASGTLVAGTNALYGDLASREQARKDAIATGLTGVGYNATQAGVSSLSQYMKYLTQLGGAKANLAFGAPIQLGNINANETKNNWETIGRAIPSLSSGFGDLTKMFTGGQQGDSPYPGNSSPNYFTPSQPSIDLQSNSYFQSPQLPGLQTNYDVVPGMA